MQAQCAFHVAQGPRENIEDAAAVLTFSASSTDAEKAALLVVCDGVGGHSGGEIASNAAIRHILRAMAGPLIGKPGGANRPQTRLGDCLKQALANANQALLQGQREDGRFRTMATTVVCAVLSEGALHVAWAGDSRAYLCRDGMVAQLTQDHSVVAELIRSGVLNEKMARSHPQAHVITSSLGRKDCVLAVRRRRIQPGDLILLCTDGFSDVVSERQIADFVRLFREGHISLEDLPEHLAEVALQLDTQDNVTVVCCEYLPDASQAPIRSHTQTAAYPVARAEACRTLFQEEPS